MKLTKKRSAAYILLLFTTIIWGLATPIVKKGYEFGLTPSTFLIGRMTIAFILSLPLFFIFRNKKDYKKTLSFKNLSKIIPLEILGTVVTLLLLYKGIELTTAIETSLIAMTYPLMVVFGSIIFLKEKQERHEWLGLAIAFFGTFILVIKPILTSQINGTVTGNALVLGQNITFAAYVLMAKKYYKGLNKWAVIQTSLLVGAIAFLIIALLNTPVSQLITQFTFTSPWPWIAIFYMAIPGSLLAATFFLIGQDRIEASEASFFTYLSPVITIPASIFLLGESITSIEIVATIIILFGVYFAEKR